MRLKKISTKKENTKLFNEIDKQRIPEHVAIIMDGNGRWATNKGLPRSFGHNKGVSVLKDIIKVSPQPAQSYAIIHFLNEVELGNRGYSIYNVIGEKVYAGDLLNDKQLIIDTSSWESGVYYIQINMENRNLTYRFAVE